MPDHPVRRCSPFHIQPCGTRYRITVSSPKLSIKEGSPMPPYLKILSKLPYAYRHYFPNWLALLFSPVLLTAKPTVEADGIVVIFTRLLKYASSRQSQQIFLPSSGPCFSLCELSARKDGGHFSWPCLSIVYEGFLQSFPDESIFSILHFPSRRSKAVISGMPPMRNTSTIAVFAQLRVTWPFGARSQTSFFFTFFRFMYKTACLLNSSKDFADVSLFQRTLNPRMDIVFLTSITRRAVMGLLFWNTREASS